jgi:hypothetical protein
MKIHTKEQMEGAYDALTPAMQELIFSESIEAKVKEVGAVVAILTNGISTLNNLTNFAILKLIDKQEFTDELSAQLKIASDIAQKITTDIYTHIVEPLQPAAISDKKKEVVGEIAKIESEKKTIEAAVVSKTNVTPPNLPTAPEPEHLIPPIAPKVFEPVVVPEQVAPHPFEEKMKQVFTPSAPIKEALVLEPTVPKEVAPSMYVADTLVPKTPPVAPVPASVAVPQVAPASSTRRVDPYREPIE